MYYRVFVAIITMYGEEDERTVMDAHCLGVTAGVWRTPSRDIVLQQRRTYSDGGGKGGGVMINTKQGRI